MAVLSEKSQTSGALDDFFLKLQDGPGQFARIVSAPGKNKIDETLGLPRSDAGEFGKYLCQFIDRVHKSKWQMPNDKSN